MASFAHPSPRPRGRRTGIRRSRRRSLELRTPCEGGPPYAVRRPLVALARGHGSRIRGDRPALPAQPRRLRGRLRPPDPEDVVQESLIRSWDALRESNREMNLKAWLYTIVRNRALNARRDARPTKSCRTSLDGVRQPPDVVLSATSSSASAAVSRAAGGPAPGAGAKRPRGHTHEQIATAIGGPRGRAAADLSRSDRRPPWRRL